MKISIFTPTNDPKYLAELYASIKDQDFHQWVIVTNGRQFEIGKFVVPEFNDPRVQVHFRIWPQGHVGGLKRFATSLCTGDILLEVDHDDLLTKTAIADVRAAFTDPEVGFAYSNFAEFKNHFEKAVLYDLSHGWKYRPFIYDGYELEECLAFAPTPAALSRVWYAPNHLRAWRRSVYEEIGGHNPDLKILDDQDLLCRTFLATKMKHIEKCLYLYRVHGNNTHQIFNAEIQRGTMAIYDRYVVDMALKWAKDSGLRALDLGAAINPTFGFEAIDIKLGQDLEKPWPFEDGSVGVIRSVDFLEHLSDKLHAIKEIHRVLAPGGYLFAETPCALSQGGFQDPTHKSFYVLNSFKYYTESRFAKYIDTPVRFQAMSLNRTALNTDNVSWIAAHLVALKENVVVPGPITI